ncbi:MAG: 8-amino-7-oxononanoate synthase [Proteobacteria bacterium]|nr:8-amino-7-oxononanoate synthase [Pseudomonadota bacterium]
MRSFEQELAQLERAQLRRRRLTVEAFTAPAQRVGLRIEGRELTDFSSNDYLGLAREPALARAMAECAARAGAGSAASHLVSGHGREHAQLEEALAEFTGRERALLFGSGYAANLAVMSSLAGRGERALLDKLSHASLIDGARLSGAQLQRYRHADAAAARQVLGAAGAPVAVLATDGVFSMDGDLAPLPALAQAAAARGARLIVDDAHGLGVIGPTGRGSLEHFGLDAHAVPVLVGTLGKAFGSYGAFVAGEAALVEFLLQKARSYIYTTALPQPVAAASRVALELVRREGWRRERVRALTARFRARALAAGVPLMDSATPIQPVVLGSAAAVLAVQARLQAAGYLVVAIRPPTVPQGRARLRIALSAAHEEAQVDALVDALAAALAATAAHPQVLA